jgi:hypothetical protein
MESDALQCCQACNFKFLGQIFWVNNLDKLSFRIWENNLDCSYLPSNTCKWNPMPYNVEGRATLIFLVRRFGSGLNFFDCFLHLQNFALLFDFFPFCIIWNRTIKCLSLILKLGDSPANLLINHGVMATLQERRLRYHSRAGLEPGTSRFSTLRINHYADQMW